MKTPEKTQEVRMITSCPDGSTVHVERYIMAIGIALQLGNSKSASNGKCIAKVR